MVKFINFIHKSRFSLTSLGIFLSVFALSYLIEINFHLMQDRRGGYNLHHFLFGVGGPFLAMTFMSIGTPIKDLKPTSALKAIRTWAINFYRLHLLGREYRAALLLMAAVSFCNEALVYWLRNPGHGVDWDHMMSDGLGMFVAWTILRPLCARAALSLGLRPAHG